MRIKSSIIGLAIALATLSPVVAMARVAVVTGATRGIGRGIALELGSQGYTVYALGRSSRGKQTSERAVAADLDLTVESAAEAINAAGGTGYGIACDLNNDDAISAALALVSEAEGGQLDLLVCSAYTTPPGKLRGDFWTQGTAMWDACNGVGLRGVYSACVQAVPMMIDTAEKSGASSNAPPPLIVLVSSFGGKSYTFNVAYGVGKAAIDRLATDMGYQLGKRGVGTVSLYPGVVKTEGNLEMERRGEWAEASGGLALADGESPMLSGKAVAALGKIGKEEFMSKYTGKVAVVAELASELGFAEADGSVPASIRSLKYLAPNFIFPQIEEESGEPVPDWIKENVPDIKLPWSVFSSGPPPDPPVGAAVASDSAKGSVSNGPGAGD